MKCKEYIFKLTSGQLEDADLLVRLSAVQHRLTCRHCRAFTRNDEKIDRILGDYAKRVAGTGPDESASGEEKA